MNPGATHDYQNCELPIEARVADLLPRMTVTAKIGLMFHPSISLNDPADVTAASSLDPTTRIPAAELVRERGITHFLPDVPLPPRAQAEWHNNLQALAADTPLGVPITLSSDPRHSFTDNPLTSLRSGTFSQWPESLGLAAVGSDDLVREYADTIRREYVAVGLRVALHPGADLATEPRWPRMIETFGEDAKLASRLVVAYVEGLRGPAGQITTNSVSAMVKHFPGGGPQRDGEDPHFSTGREQVYPGGRFDYHLAPFRAAIAAGVRQIMPYYGMPVGTSYEEVGFGFNRGVVSDLLRGRLGFDGIVCTDWCLITDVPTDRGVFQARAWGVEKLSREQRVLKAVDAGVDQFGGESCSDLLEHLVRSGAVSESRIDDSAARLLAEKFALGLFDEQRYVDPDEAERVVGHPDLRQAGRRAQARSVTVLNNGAPEGSRDRILPLTGRPLLYVENVDRDIARAHAAVVDTPQAADVAILRIAAPYEPRPGHESGFHAGRLDFPEPEIRRILAITRAVPTIVVIYLDRAAVIPEIADASTGLVAVFGVSDEALFLALTGQVPPQGRLPFQLPRSMDEVLAGRPDVPQESSNPLYPFGHGVRLTPPNTPAHDADRAAAGALVALDPARELGLLDASNRRSYTTGAPPDRGASPDVVRRLGNPGL